MVKRKGWMVWMWKEGMGIELEMRRYMRTDRDYGREWNDGGCEDETMGDEFGMWERV